MAHNNQETQRLKTDTGQMFHDFNAINRLAPVSPEQARQATHSAPDPDAPSAPWAEALVSNEFWFQDIPRSADTFKRNVTALTLGLPADIVGVLASIPLAAPGTFPINTATNTPADFNLAALTDIPGGSTQIANAIGGDPESGQFLAASALAPTPGKLLIAGKAMFIGAIGGRRLGGEAVQRLSKFLAKKDTPIFDEKAWKETSWYLGGDGEPRFFISDQDALIRMDIIQSHPQVVRARQNVEALGVDGSVIEIDFKLPDILRHDELYKTYPQIRHLSIRLNLVLGQGDQLQFRNPSRRSTAYGALESSGPDTIRRLTLHNLKDVNAVRTTVLHETQHTIQKIEGWAQGGTTAVNEEALKALDDNIIITQAFKMIDEGAATPDALYIAARAHGFDNGEARMIVGFPATQRYQAGDDQVRNMFNIEVAGQRADVENDIGFLLDFLFASEGGMKGEGVELLERLADKFNYQDLKQLTFRAYQNLYGEAESRLTELLQFKSKEVIDALPTPPNPALATRTFKEDIGTPLSIRGKRSPPIMDVVERFGGPSTSGAEATNINIKSIDDYENALQTISDDIDELVKMKDEVSKFGPVDVDNLKDAKFADVAIRDLIDEKIDFLQGQFEQLEDARNLLGPE